MPPPKVRTTCRIVASASVTATPQTRFSTLVSKGIGCTLALCVLTLLAPASRAIAAEVEPLSVQIDRLLETTQTGPVAPTAGDAEFLRRVSLDLTGDIPSPEEVRAFLADANPGKRAALVERLLADSRSSLHLAELFDVMLMERRPDQAVTRAEWLKYLQDSFQQNKPWNQLAREIIAADGTDPSLRPAAKFFLERDADPHLMTRDVGRMFLGVDFQCCQCHDHPLVENYLQPDYYGLFAFVNRTYVFDDKANKRKVLGERAEGDLDYKSVFTGVDGRSKPRLPESTDVAEPHLKVGDEYVEVPTDKARGVPKHSRRAMLAEQATNGSSPAFNRNLPNRMWSLLMGRGLVHPVDFQHAHNPPASPAVLDLLTQEFVASKFDIKGLIRQLMLTKAYQVSFDLPADPNGLIAKAQEQLPQIEAELLKLKSAVETAAKAELAAYEAMGTARQASDAKYKPWDEAQKAALTLEKPVVAAVTALNATQAQVTAKKGLIAAIAEAHAKSTELVKLLPKDAEVAQATKIFETKQATATTELAALEKTTTDQTAAVAAARVPFDKAVEAAEAAFAAYTEASKPWEAAKVVWTSARAQSAAAELALASAEVRHKALRQYADYGQKQQYVAAAEARLPVLKTEIATLSQTVEQQAGVVAQRTAAMTETQKAMAAVAQKLDAAKAEVARRQAVVSAVVAATAKTEEALANVPAQPDLVAALEKLKSRREPLATDVKAAEQVVATCDAEMKAAVAQLESATQLVAVAQADLATTQKAMADKSAAMGETETQLAATRAALPNVFSELTDRWANEFATRQVKPLTPEQLAWATMEACGVVAGNRGNVEAEVEKTVPKASVQNDPAKLADRQFQVERLLREKLHGVVAQFLQFYAPSGGQPQDVFFTTADQALFVANGGTIRSWLPPSGSNLAARLVALQDPTAFADELYVSVLSRRPNEAEVAETTKYLAARPNDRPAAIQELIWGLLASAEFRFNH